MPTTITRLVITMSFCLLGEVSAQLTVENGRTGRTEADRRFDRELAENTRKLDVALLLDRGEYLPRENAALSVKVVNLTASPLQVYDLLAADQSTIMLAGSKQEARHRRFSETKSILMLPGESRSAHFELDSELCESKGIAWPVCSLPKSPGVYYMNLQMWGYVSPQISFRIVRPEIESVLEVMGRPVVRALHDQFGRPDGRRAEIKSYSRVYLLRKDGSKVVCATKSGVTSSLQESKERGDELLLGALSCVYPSSGEITNLRAAVHDQESDELVLTFQVAGREQMRVLDKSRRSIK